MSPELESLEMGQRFHDDYSQTQSFMENLVSLLKGYENRIDELETQIRNLKQHTYGDNYQD